MNPTFRTLILALTCCCTAFPAAAQGRLVLNGATVVLQNGAQLVLANSAANALTGASGGIAGHSLSDKLYWHTGTATGTYQVPFLHNGQRIPLSFTKTAGAGAGAFSFATYATPAWQNSLYLPEGMLNVNSGPSDNSRFVLDRHWDISTSGYSTKPALSNLTFSYLDSELLAPNTITESNLKAQRWNDNYQYWDDYRPSGTVNTAANTVTVAEVPPEDLFRYWVLVEEPKPLPVELVKFTATASGSHTNLYWETAQEKDSDYFAVERSQDGQQFTELLRQRAAGTTAHRSRYSAQDLQPLPGFSYYRLRQVDTDGATSYSPVRAVQFGNNSAPPALSVFPNPAQQQFGISLSGWEPGPVQLFLTDLQGRVLYHEQVQVTAALTQHTPRHLPQLPAGTYLLSATGSKEALVQRLVIR